MLFNSHLFMLVYLPIVFGTFIWVSRIDHYFGVLWLLVASLAFYGWWDVRYVLLLAVSIAFNYIVGRGLARTGPDPASRRTLLTAGIATNLIVLAFFKYTDFLIATVNQTTGTQLPRPQIVLPLGISFFTFTQIAFLVDAYMGKASELSLTRYGLFVSYFPHLIAGPVLHHAEMMPQFADRRASHFSPENIAVGLTIFFIGLFKKVILADGASTYVGPVFDHIASPSLLVSWFTALAYTVQIYFDFSGYSDMAIGISRLFGVVLPLNFHSPYKAPNIIEFWRRWHMTLSRFLRDYLYIPLGGNRKGPVRRHINLMTTMLLGGLWHGAGWTFVIWGGLHGIYLIVNHLWHVLRQSIGLTGPATRSGTIAARALTFACVVVAWVFFRAPTFEAAVRMINGMAGRNGIELPAHLLTSLGPAGDWLQRHGVRFRFLSSTLDPAGVQWIILLLIIAFLCPNTQQIMHAWRPALAVPPDRPARFMRLNWAPTTPWAVAVAALAGWATLNFSGHSEFLYFQF